MSAAICRKAPICSKRIWWQNGNPTSASKRKEHFWLNSGKKFLRIRRAFWSSKCLSRVYKCKCSIHCLPRVLGDWIIGWNIERNTFKGHSKAKLSGILHFFDIKSLHTFFMSISFTVKKNYYEQLASLLLTVFSTCLSHQKRFHEVTKCFCNFES